MKNAFFLETQNVKVGIEPQSGLGALTGARIGMSKSEKVAVVLAVGATAAADVNITFKQHDAATAGNSKDLEIDNKYFVKAGTATKFTQVEPTAKAATFELTDLDGVAGLAVFEVRAADLDLANGYSHMSVNTGAAGVAKIVSVNYIQDNVYKLPGYSEEI